MAVLYTPHFVQFFDDDGDPLNGGLLYTYEAGTTTPKATYTDSTGGTPNANPVVLDSAGRATIFLSGSYKFTLKDSAGNTIKTTDNVTSFTTSVSGSVSDIIGDYTDATVATGDSFVFADASDSNTTRRDTIQGILDLASYDVVLVSSGSASAASYINATGMDSTYSRYIVSYSIIGSASGAGTIHYSEDAGSSLISSANYKYHIAIPDSSASTYTGVNSTGATSIRIDINNTTNNTAAGLIFLNGMGISAFPAMTFFAHRWNGGVMYNQIGSGGYSSAITANAIRITPGSGTLTGTVRVYGLVDS